MQGSSTVPQACLRTLKTHTHNSLGPRASNTVGSTYRVRSPKASAYSPGHKLRWQDSARQSARPCTCCTIPAQGAGNRCGRRGACGARVPGGTVARACSSWQGCRRPIGASRTCHTSAQKHTESDGAKVACSMRVGGGGWVCMPTPQTHALAHSHMCVGVCMHVQMCCAGGSMGHRRGLVQSARGGTSTGSPSHPIRAVPTHCTQGHVCRGGTGPTLETSCTGTRAIGGRQAQRRTEAPRCKQPEAQVPTSTRFRRDRTARCKLTWGPSNNQILGGGRHTPKLHEVGAPPDVSCIKQELDT
jgi:hypothetical protein